MLLKGNDGDIGCNSLSEASASLRLECGCLLGAGAVA